MAKIDLSENNEVLLKTSLSKGQISKFNSLVEAIIIFGNSAYIPITLLHGVLLTRSKNNAIEILNKHQDIFKKYILKDPSNESNTTRVIRPVGLLLLLDELANENPRRATEYRGSSALLTYIIAGHPQLAFNALIEAKNMDAELNSVVYSLKKEHIKCQLSNHIFTKNDQKHAHHVLGQAENPSEIKSPENIIIIRGDIHNAYHDWVTKQKLQVNRGTLWQFANEQKFISPLFQKSQ
jgi:hypothetical protein